MGTSEYEAVLPHSSFSTFARSSHFGFGAFIANKLHRMTMAVLNTLKEELCDYGCHSMAKFNTLLRCFSAVNSWWKGVMCPRLVSPLIAIYGRIDVHVRRIDRCFVARPLRPRFRRKGSRRGIDFLERWESDWVSLIISCFGCRNESFKGPVGQDLCCIQRPWRNQLELRLNLSVIRHATSASTEDEFSQSVLCEICCIR